MSKARLKEPKAKDLYRPQEHIGAEVSPRWVRVRFNSEFVADSQRVLLVLEHGRLPAYYFPKRDVHRELLSPSDTRTRCPYKGVVSYWSVRLGDKTFEDYAWSYPDPIPEIPKIKGLLCFFNEKVDIFVDGERQERPETPWS